MLRSHIVKPPFFVWPRTYHDAIPVVQRVGLSLVIWFFSYPRRRYLGTVDQPLCTKQDERGTEGRNRQKGPQRMEMRYFRTCCEGGYTHHTSIPPVIERRGLDRPSSTYHKFVFAALLPPPCRVPLSTPVLLQPLRTSTSPPTRATTCLAQRSFLGRLCTTGPHSYCMSLRRSKLKSACST